MNVCKYCDTQFPNDSKGRKKNFCNKSCSAKYRTKVLKIFGRKKIGKYIFCKFCNKEIYTVPSLPKKQFCSRKCSAKYNKNGSKLRNGKLVKCKTCNDDIYIQPSVEKQKKNKIFFCSRKCKHEAMKKGITAWGFKKDGIEKKSNPYPRKQIKGVRMKEHRRIMEEHLGRKLLSTEVIHHINENPEDNRIENLLLTNNIEHARIHKSKK